MVPSAILCGVSFFRAEVLALLFCAFGLHADSTFTNPLLQNGPDPWVIYDNGFYYYTNTTATNITLWKTRDITDLQHAEKKAIWTPPPGRPYSRQIWAPELHKLNGRWYVYFAADSGNNESHRLYVLEDASPDPFSGEWQLKGPVEGLQDHWAIDPTVFENRHREYIVWSGWPADVDGVQNLYIARLKTPWKIRGKRVLISTPQYEWERFGGKVTVNEGPEMLKHDSKLFLIYSASGCWTDHYALGMLVASTDSDVLDPTSWKKIDHPVFSSSPAAHAFGTGHNTFFRSPDGRQDWILYHANPEPNQGCDAHRSPRAQPFTWYANGFPDFGAPLPLGERLSKPSGTPDPQ
jgi:GH43 family beta-xylosidase